MNTTYQIGAFSFRILCQDQIQPPKNLALFQTDVDKVDYTYHINISDQFPICQGKKLAQRKDLSVFQTETGESRFLGILGIPGYYASYQETGTDWAEITVIPSCVQMLNIDTIFNSMLALERRMIGLNSLVLHCSYTRYLGEAILFSAPSGTGKSTQSRLWEQFRGAETINGDRGLIRNVDERWVVQGWPVCGSSGICCNVSTPIKAIVMLTQEKENHVKRLEGMTAFRQLFSQITVNRWNTEYVQQAMNLLDAFCGTVPVYHLGCTISEDAVKCLEQVLY